MNELEIINLYEQSDDNKNKDFYENINSNLRVVTNYDKTSTNFEWLDIMEDTIRYLDNILRNPNRFIINEEDIVKIELARRVTVESIKHLSKNTNLIQDIDKKTGDVKPSKILNINKEESFNTYENRFIYSLIKNMRMFIEKKKRTNWFLIYIIHHFICSFCCTFNHLFHTMHGDRIFLHIHISCYSHSSKYSHHCHSFCFHIITS